MEPQYLTERQVSQMTGIKISTLRNHRHRRIGLPYIKYGSMVLYKVEDVCGHLDERRIDFDDHPAGSKKNAAPNKDVWTPQLGDDRRPRSSADNTGRHSPAGKSPVNWIGQAPPGG